ncbi:MAG: peptidoglycan-binding domain-containing protein [Planctomycetota bacterium]|nr:peptidoglycan-binding domain-containing protein [Planctomycetota bacterium]
MAGKNRQVVEGEWLGKIAAEEGFSDGGAAIWGDPKNAHAKEKHPNPNLLCEHVELFIPEKKPKVVPRAAAAKHRFVAARAKTVLRIQIVDMDGNPRENEPYRLLVGLVEFRGKTFAGPGHSDATGTWGPGMIRHEIPVASTRGSIELTNTGEVLDFKVGMLREIDPGHKNILCVIKAAQARLNNLGFGCGSVDGISGKKTKAAIHAFQAFCKEHKAKLGFDSGTADGILGPITRAALKRAHGEL